MLSFERGGRSVKTMRWVVRLHDRELLKPCIRNTSCLLVHTLVLKKSDVWLAVIGTDRFLFRLLSYNLNLVTQVFCQRTCLPTLFILCSISETWICCAQTWMGTNTTLLSVFGLSFETLQPRLDRWLLLWAMSTPVLRLLLEEQFVLWTVLPVTLHAANVLYFKLLRHLSQVVWWRRIWLLHCCVWGLVLQLARRWRQTCSGFFAAVLHRSAIWGWLAVWIFGLACHSLFKFAFSGYLSFWSWSFSLLLILLGRRDRVFTWRDTLFCRSPRRYHFSTIACIGLSRW